MKFSAYVSKVNQGTNSWTKCLQQTIYLINSIHFVSKLSAPDFFLLTQNYVTNGLCKQYFSLWIACKLFTTNISVSTCYLYCNLSVAIWFCYWSHMVFFFVTGYFPQNFVTATWSCHTIYICTSISILIQICMSIFDYSALSLYANIIANKILPSKYICKVN